MTNLKYLEEVKFLDRLSYDTIYFKNYDLLRPNLYSIKIYCALIKIILFFTIKINLTVFFSLLLILLIYICIRR